jgi:hypothetical protein
MHPFSALKMEAVYFRNVCKYLQIHTALLPRRITSNLGYDIKKIKNLINALSISR